MGNSYHKGYEAKNYNKPDNSIFCDYYNFSLKKRESGGGYRGGLWLCSSLKQSRSKITGKTGRLHRRTWGGGLTPTDLVTRRSRWLGLSILLSSD